MLSSTLRKKPVRKHLCACSLSLPPRGVTVVNNFDAKRYLGTWYEIARFDHRFEHGLEKVTATYSLR
ncbi:TPA: lipocalin family protein, partial [Shigella flexneri Y]